MKWINVEDELPEEFEFVVVRYLGISKAGYKFESRYWLETTEKSYWSSKKKGEIYTHWLTLVDPSEELNE